MPVYDPATSGVGTSISSAEIENDSIVNADINSAAAIDFSKLATLTSTNLLVGSAGNVATSTAVTGDVTIGNTGVTAIGSAKVTDAKMVNPNNSVYRTIFLAQARVTTAAAQSTNYMIGGSSDVLVGAINGSSTFATFMFQAADYAVGTLTTKMRLVLTIQTPNTAPAVTFVGGVYPLTNTTTSWTAGTITSGSTTTLTTPGANAATTANSGDFTIPSDGILSPIFSFTGAANPASAVALIARVQVRNV